MVTTSESDWATVLARQLDGQQLPGHDCAHPTAAFGAVMGLDSCTLVVGLCLDVVVVDQTSRMCVSAFCVWSARDCEACCDIVGNTC